MSQTEKLGVVFMVFFIVVLLILIVFGPSGLMDYLNLKDKENKIHQQTARIQVENQKLAKQINDLKKDPEYIEHVAKHSHEMVTEDELIFKFKKSEPSDTGTKEQ